MKLHRLAAGLRLFFMFTFSVGLFATSTFAQWTQWGGPNRDFRVEASGLADVWPEGGPKKLWHRELGDGYGTILVDGDAIYTVYRIDQDEFTVALDAKSGATLWEHKIPSPTTQLMEQYGAGPSSTPLIVGDHLYSIGTNMVMHCFDKKTGKIIWHHDLIKEYEASLPGRGYCASPIAYKNSVIILAGHDAKSQENGGAKKEESKNPPAEKVSQALMAFDQGTGSLLWKMQSHDVTHSSPILIQFNGQDQLVALLAKDLIGVNPNNGELLWEHALKPEGANLATPVWLGDGKIFCSSAYDSGSRVIQLKVKNGKTVTEELWYSRKMRLHHANPVQIGDYVYGSSGDFGPAFFAAMNIHTGKAAWRKRGFSKATCILADGKLILLDEDGQLALAKVSPQGMDILSKCTISEKYSWAAPTLVEKTLYVRDRKHIMAFDLGS